MKFEDLARLWFLKQLNISVDEVDFSKMGEVSFDTSAAAGGYGCDTCDYYGQVDFEVSAHVVFNDRRREYRYLPDFSDYTDILKSILEFEQTL